MCTSTLANPARSKAAAISTWPLTPCSRKIATCGRSLTAPWRAIRGALTDSAGSNVSRGHLDTQLIIDRQHSDWMQSGLRQPSAINCSNLYTIEQADVAKVIGSLSPSTMKRIDERLKTVLDIE